MTQKNERVRHENERMIGLHNGHEIVEVWGEGKWCGLFINHNLTETWLVSQFPGSEDLPQQKLFFWEGSFECDVLPNGDFANYSVETRKIRLARAEDLHRAGILKH